MTNGHEFSESSDSNSYRGLRRCIHGIHVYRTAFQSFKKRINASSPVDCRQAFPVCQVFLRWPVGWQIVCGALLRREVIYARFLLSFHAAAGQLGFGFTPLHPRKQTATPVAHARVQTWAQDPAPP
jgi:hypothetical protein